LTDLFREQELQFSDLNYLAEHSPLDLLNGINPVSKATWASHAARQTRAGQGFLKAVKAGDVLFLFDREQGYSLMDWELLRERLFSVLACWRAIRWDEVPRARLTVIAERGFKTRPVTPIEGAFAYLLTGVNSLLKASAALTPGRRGGLRGFPDAPLEWDAQAPWKDGQWTRSLDLTSASDRLPLGMMQAGAEGWITSSRCGPSVARLLRRAVGPFDLTQPDGTVARTCRGLLMGVGTTWVLLCYYTEWLCVRAGSTGSPQVIGDDLLVTHSKRSDVRMTQVVARTGGRLSHGKDYSVAGPWGLLAEQLVNTKTRKVYGTISIRALMGSGDDREGLPRYALGDQVARAVERGGEVFGPAAVRVVAELFRKEMSQLSSWGVAPTRPRWLGGAGFPGPSTISDLRCARGLASQSPQFQLEFMETVGRAWVPSAAVSGGEVLKDEYDEWRSEFVFPLSLGFLHRREFAPQPEFWGGGAFMDTDGKPWIPADELWRSFSLARAAPFVIATGCSRADAKWCTTRFVKVMTRALKELRAVSYWVPVEATREGTSGIRRMIDVERLYADEGAIPRFRDVCL